MERAVQGTVLIVDDDAKVLKTTSLLLEGDGFATLAYSSAEIALRDLSASEVDVVLTDIVMPGMTGIELLEEIHRRHPEIPVILMTAYADMDKAMEAVRKGAFDFILKPFKLEQLLHPLKKAVEFRRLTGLKTRYRNVLEELNSEIETLVAERTMNMMALTVADRMRNPSSVIGLVCRRLLESGEASEKVAEGLGMIAAEAEKLEGIVREFQSFLEQKESLYTYEDLNRVVRDAALVIEQETRRSGVKLVLELREGSLPINMEKNLVKVAVLHLVRNALEATPRGGTVAVRTSGDGNTVAVEIADTGHGIRPEIRDKIFDPFFTTKEHRFGMGLPLIRQIATEHNGELRIDGRPEGGTVASLTFPARWEERDSSR